MSDDPPWFYISLLLVAMIGLLIFTCWVKLGSIEDCQSRGHALQWCLDTKQVDTGK